MTFSLNLIGKGMTMKFLKSEEKYDDLHPRLNAVLLLIYNKRPLLEYCVETVMTDPSGQKLAITASVWQHGQEIGRVYGRQRRWSPTKQQDVIWYGIECRQIKKSRGDRDTKYFKEPKPAAKLAVELFSKKTLAELGIELVSTIGSPIKNLVDRTIYEFKDMVRMPDVSARVYFLEKHLGHNPPTPLNIKVTDESVRAYENMKIAENVYRHLHANNGYAIRFMRDETLLVTDLRNTDQTFKYQSTYEMPQFMQEKFTMLKLLEVNQFAADIGVRLHSPTNDLDTLYFIVAGETVVH